MSQIEFGNAFGFIGKDYSLVAADCFVPRSIVVMKENDDKILQISDRTLFASVGAPADRKNFGDYIKRNIKWYEMRNSKKLSNKEIASYTRNTLAYSIRNSPYLTWVIQAGYDEKVGPSIYWMDYFGSLASTKTAASGLAQYFLLSLFDANWKKDMSEEDGIKLAKVCISQLEKRFCLQTGNFVIKIVNKDGVKIVNVEKKSQLQDVEVNEEKKEDK